MTSWTIRQNDRITNNSTMRDIPLLPSSIMSEVVRCQLKRSSRSSNVHLSRALSVDISFSSLVASTENIVWWSV